ncbi:metallo-beta-lactamase domain-containing protein 1-like [Ciona intestinalis]
MSKSKINILQTGYCLDCPTDKSKFTADCTVTLIENENKSPILVDTSGPWASEKLKSDIHGAGYTLDDIKTVVCTHGHSDHIGNLNLFLKAKFFVGFDIFCGNVYETFDFKSPSAKYIVRDDIEIIATPGHTNADISVIVKNTDLGTVVIAGDTFENDKDYLDAGSVWKSLSENIDQQEISRDKILSIADYIVPGHGKMFNASVYKSNACNQ